MTKLQADNIQLNMNSSELILNESLEILSSAVDLNDRWRLLIDIMAGFGADQINYAVLDVASGGRASAGVIQFSNMDPTWIDHYLDTRLDLHDPHVRFVRERGIRPYRFHEELGAQLENPHEADVISQAAEAGLRSQFSVIALDRYGRGEPIGGMSIGSSLPAGEFFSAMDGQEMAMLSVAMMFHDLSQGEIRRVQAKAERLTPRERDCLTWLALGYRAGRIAERLGIAEVTVELHLRNGRRKLKARTSAEAVARGMLFGEIVI